MVFMFLVIADLNFAGGFGHCVIIYMQVNMVKFYIYVVNKKICINKILSR